MKKNYSKVIGTLLVIALYATSCKKETSENVITSPETALQSASVKPKNECRVTQIFESGRESIYRYNSLGLVDEWEILDFGIYRIDYNEHGIPVKATFYAGSDVLWTVEFFYKNGRIYKEVWFDIPTNQIWDEYFYTYDSKGQMVKGESSRHDYYVNTKYTPEGNVLSWELFQGGTIASSGHYTYDRPYKNPRRAAQGIIYDFVYYDSAHTFSKWWYSSAKYVWYDENGVPNVDYNFDPAKTIWQLGHQNYPLSATYFDLSSNQTWLPPATFTYDNCEPGNDNTSSQISLLPKTAGKSNSRTSLTRNTLKPLKEQVKELRQRHQK